MEKLEKRNLSIEAAMKIQLNERSSYSSELDRIF